MIFKTFFLFFLVKLSFSQIDPNECLKQIGSIQDKLFTELSKRNKIFKKAYNLTNIADAIFKTNGRISWKSSNINFDLTDIFANKTLSFKQSCSISPSMSDIIYKYEVKYPLSSQYAEITLNTTDSANNQIVYNFQIAIRAYIDLSMATSILKIPKIVISNNVKIDAVMDDVDISFCKLIIANGRPVDTWCPEIVRRVLLNQYFKTWSSRPLTDLNEFVKASLSNIPLSLIIK
jgi:hypothetical protein